MEKAMLMIASMASMLLIVGIWSFVPIYLVNLRWRLFGWRPKIYIKEIISTTVMECVVKTVEREKRIAENAGHLMTVQEEGKRIAQCMFGYEEVIEQYIKNFVVAKIQR